MADDVVYQSTTPSTPPDGTRVSSEEVTTLNGQVVTAQQDQRVALTIVTADATAIDLPGNSANGLDVDVTRVQGTVTVGDGGGSLTVDGAITATLPVGDDVIGRVKITDGTDVALVTAGGLLQVDASGVAVPVTDNSGSLTVDGPLTDVELRASDVKITLDGEEVVLGAGTNNIGDVDVLTLPSIPAGTNNIGDVDIASIAAGDNNIGNVDIVTLPAPLNVVGGGTEATALRITVANDSTGLLSVDDNGSSLTVDQSTASNLKEEMWGGAKGATVAATSTMTPAGVDHNALDVVIRDGNGNELELRQENENWNAADHGILMFGRDTESNPNKYRAITLDANGHTQVDVITLPTLPAGTNNIGDVDILTVPAPLNVVGGGTEATALRVTIASDSTGVLSVDDNGASLTVDGTVTASNVTGNVADDDGDSGNPVKIGGKVKSFDGTDPGSVSAENDRADATFDNNRRLYVNSAHPNHWSVVENNATAQTNNAIKGTPGANLSLYITDVVMSTDTAGNIKIVEDTAGTPVTKVGPLYFAANGGAALHFQTPIRITANKDIGYTSSMTGNHTVQVNGFIAP